MEPAMTDQTSISTLQQGVYCHNCRKKQHCNISNARMEVSYQYLSLKPALYVYNLSSVNNPGILEIVMVYWVKLTMPKPYPYDADNVIY